MKKNKEKKNLLLLLVGAGLAYYFFVYLPEEEENNKKKQSNQHSSASQEENRSPEEIQKELEENAWEKGRIWELPVHNWADRIVKGKSSSLIGEYQKFANLFPDGDKDERFYFSRAAPYTIHFPPSLEDYYEKGKDLELNCNLLEEEEELVLSKAIDRWIERVEHNPIRGKKDRNKKDNSALFYGAPGTGKTATMKNLCYNADKYPLVEIKGSNLTPTEADQKAEILPLQKFAYTISELEWSLVKDYGFERKDNGEVRYILFVDEANQISNNSLVFQPNKLKFLKDCLEGVNQDERSNNLWVFATNHLDQIEEAVYREGRLSNPLDFSWTWEIFLKHANEESIFYQLPQRWRDTKYLKPEDDEQVAKFNIKVFQKDFLGNDSDDPSKPKFWNLFITNNPDAQIETEEDEVNESGKKTGNKVKEDIEIGEFLEFFWAIKKRNLYSYDGNFENITKLTIEAVLDTRLIELIEVLDEKLHKLIEEVNKSRLEGKEQITDGIRQIISSLANR
jgi:hypothetical protein